jgi:hypothetical protein
VNVRSLLEISEPSRTHPPYSEYPNQIVASQLSAGIRGQLLNVLSENRSIVEGVSGSPLERWLSIVELSHNVQFPPETGIDLRRLTDRIQQTTRHSHRDLLPLFSIWHE